VLSFQVHAAKAKGKPYTIVFVGVNGVGKSTNLSKVAYWLLQNDITVGSHLSLSVCNTKLQDSARESLYFCRPSSANI